MRCPESGERATTCRGGTSCSRSHTALRRIARGRSGGRAPELATTVRGCPPASGGRLVGRQLLVPRRERLPGPNRTHPRSNRVRSAPQGELRLRRCTSRFRCAPAGTARRGLRARIAETAFDSLGDRRGARTRRPPVSPRVATYGGGPFRPLPREVENGKKCP